MSQLGFLPITLVLLAALTFIVCYIIAVARGDVRAAFPYISDTGSERPESCIFGQFLNLAAFLAFCTMYVRYKAVEAITINIEEDRWLRRMNIGSMTIGILSALGCSIVANFQEGTSVEVVHIVGAGMTFCFGILYCFLSTAMTYHMCPDYNGRCICRVRLGACLASLAGLIVTIVAAGVALHEWDNAGGKKNKFKWSPDDPGYTAHVVSTGGEWFTAMAFLCFFFTYVKEFNKFELEIRTRPLVRHLDERPEPDIRLIPEPDERTKLLG